MADNVYQGDVDDGFGTANNWITGAVPANSGDTATFNGLTVGILAGSNQTAKTLVRLDQYTSCQPSIGSYNAYLQIGATTVNLGLPPADGSSSTPGAAALDFGSVNNTTNIYATRGDGEFGFPPVLLKGAGTNTINMYDGFAGIAMGLPGETSTYATVNVLGGVLQLGAGVTLTTVRQYGGDVYIRSAATTFSQEDGEAYIIGTGAITTASIDGVMHHTGTGTITTLAVGDNGNADFSGSKSAVIVTNCTVSGNGVINDPNGRVTFTNGIILRDGAKSTQLELGNRTITPS